MPGRRWLSVVTTVLLLTAVMIAPAVRAEAPPTAPVSTPTAPVPQPAAPVPGASSGNVRPSEATPPFTGSQTDQRDAWGGTTNPQGTPIATPNKAPVGDGPRVVPPESSEIKVDSAKSISIDADTWSEHTASTSAIDTVPKPSVKETRPAGEPEGDIREIRPPSPEPTNANLSTVRRAAASDQNVRVVVGFKSVSVRTQSASTVHARQGAVVVSTIPQVSADVVTLADRAAANAAIASYRADPSVAFAEIDELRYASETPNDPRFGEQWGLAMVKAPDAWSVTHGSNSVKVAVLDTGVFTSHPDLQGKVVGSANFST